MPEQYSQPCLASLAVPDLARAKPANVWIQAIVIEASRIARHDGDPLIPGISMFQVRRTYPNFYVPTQSIVFATPLMRTAGAYNWDEFLAQLQEADRACGGYRYENASKDHTDEPISDRLFIKELLLLEIPSADPRYHDRPYEPANPEDRLYDGVRCAFATFVGTHQLLGKATQEARDGWLPGATRKAMDLVGLEVVRTKHLRTAQRETWKAFHRGKGDTYVEMQENLVNHPERAAQWLPTCCETGLVIQRVAYGDWQNLPRFVPESVSLERIAPSAEEGEEGEAPEG